MNSGCRSAYRQLSQFCFAKPTWVERYPSLSSLLRRGDPFETLGLPDLHTAVLRLDSSTTFDERIASTPRELIDQQDYSGRTALSWAAELGNLDQIQKILVKGGDPNAVDSHGGTPLTHCTNEARCLAALLEAGADVNHADCAGNTKIISLVASEDNLDCIETLWRFGLDLDVRINMGKEVIFAVVERDRPRILRWMLEHGVNLEVRGKLGEFPLLRFLGSSSEKCSSMLEMLLEKTPDCSLTDNFGEGVVHYIARSSNLEDIQIIKEKIDLANLDPGQRCLCGFKPWERNDPGATPLELAAWRRDYQHEWSQECFTPLDPDPLAWFEAFESFIEFVKAARDAKRDSIIGADTSTLKDQIDANESPRVDDGTYPILPGTYPQE